MARAELALKLKPLLAAKAKEKQVKGGEEKVRQNSAEPVKVREDLAKAAGVSHDTIAKVESITTHAIPAIQAMARTGQLSVNAAVRNRERLSTLHMCRSWRSR